MVGRDVELRVVKAPAKPGEVVLTLKDLNVRDDRVQMAVKEVSTSRSARARSSPSPACRATARPSWSRRSWASVRPTPGEISVDGETSRP